MNLRIIDERPARSLLSDRSGKAVFYRQIHELLMDDGSVRFKCVHCGTISNDLMVIFRHLKEHKPPKPAPQPEDKSRAEDNGYDTNGGSLVMEFLDQKIRKLVEERDRYKARARKAERELARIRRALGVGQ